MPGLSENAISFFGAGGHKHDGSSSTLISTASYSLFDFKPSYIGSQSRIEAQVTNQTALEDWVLSIVNTKVLAPAGLNLAPGLLSGKTIRANTITAIQLQANTITADEIAANAVTANELAANLVLVNNVIMSNNYNGTIAANGAITATGNAGWAITSFGSAEFANTSIRGALTANSVSTPGLTISNTGAITSANFNVSANGTMTANSAFFEGYIDAGAGLIGNILIYDGSIQSSDYDANNGFQINSNGSAFFNEVSVKGNLMFANSVAPGTFSDGGSLTDGLIGGININSDAIESIGYSAGVAGFRISNTGSAEFNNVTVRGTMAASTITGSGISTISTPFMGLTYDQYRLNIYDTAKIRAEMRYQCDANGDGASITSYVDINNVNSAIDGARIGVTSSTGGNTQIRAGFVNANLGIYGPMLPVLAAAPAAFDVGVDGGGYLSFRSSRRELKDEIEDFIELDIIDQFVPRIFKWKKKDRGEESEIQRIARESEYAIGFIVEEVEEVQNGRFVTYEDSDRAKPLYWKTDNFIAMLVAEVQDLRKRVKELENGV
jgi:hypothetical protein